MPDVVTKVTKQGWFSRLGGSIKGIFIGILLFLVSFGVLFWNEGRYDFSKMAKDAIPISSEQLNTDAAMNGKLVSVAGKLTTGEQLGDGLYLQPGDYISLVRNVEVYAWVENSSSESETNLGGSETTTTTYTYSKEWVNDAADHSTFEEPGGHENEDKSIPDADFKVNSAKVGVYDLNIAQLSLPGPQTLSLSKEMLTFEMPDVEARMPDDMVFSDFFDDEEDTTVDLESKLRLEGTMYIFSGTGTLADPQIGDMRISYQVVPNNIEGTLFGKLDGSKITSYADKDNNKLYRFFSGSADDAVVTLHGEFKMALWLFRILGFLMMWIGLSMIFAPIGVLADVIPFLGSISRSALKFATFVISFILSVITIIVSAILHSWIALLVIAVLGAGFTYWYLKMKGQKVGAKKPEAATPAE